MLFGEESGLLKEAAAPINLEKWLKKIELRPGLFTSHCAVMNCFSSSDSRCCLLQPLNPTGFKFPTKDRSLQGASKLYILGSKLRNAYYSRCSVVMHFEPPRVERQIEQWQQLLTKFKLRFWLFSCQVQCSKPHSKFNDPSQEIQYPYYSILRSCCRCENIVFERTSVLRFDFEKLFLFAIILFLTIIQSFAKCIPTLSPLPLKPWSL